ncbi:MAG: ZIP family metal transporter [Actinomycetota bacterium]|nr:ZIP family metal transporter [Actinomycetota bacterium]
MDVNVLTVSLLALATALATGLGAAPFLLARADAGWLGPANAIAAGFMLAASVALVVEGWEESASRVAAGVLFGVLFIALTRRLVRRHEHVHIASLRGVDALRAFLIVAVMTVHSFAEGVAVGVSFGGGEALGVFITVAIAVHNIPEGLAISLVLVPRGASVLAAAAWSVVSSLPQPLIAAPAFLFVDSFSAVLPLGLGFAAGAMVWMVFAELVPEARAARSDAAAAIWGALAFAVMMAFQFLLETV